MAVHGYIWIPLAFFDTLARKSITVVRLPGVRLMRDQSSTCTSWLDRMGGESK